MCRRRKEEEKQHKNAHASLPDVGNPHEPARNAADVNEQTREHNEHDHYRRTQHRCRSLINN